VPVVPTEIIKFPSDPVKLVVKEPVAPVNILLTVKLVIEAVEVKLPVGLVDPCEPVKPVEPVFP